MAEKLHTGWMHRVHDTNTSHHFTRLVCARDSTADSEYGPVKGQSWTDRLYSLENSFQP